jgi:tellurium resistance protein TerD
VLDADGKVLSDQHFVFYNNPKDPSGRGCPSRAIIAPAKVPATMRSSRLIWMLMIPNAAKVAFVVTIHDAEARKQTLDRSATPTSARSMPSGDQEIARYDLSEDASTETAMIFGELYRNNDEWKFKAIGQGYAGGLAAVARDFGVNLG